MDFAWSADAEALPDTAGAYVLLIDLNRPVRLPSPRFDHTLPSGLYCYLGSARGPGGIRARCARHLRREKAVRWHVDWLTKVASRILVSPHTTLTECELAERLTGLDGVSIPVVGFGSSDCSRCPAHLVRVDTARDRHVFQGAPT